MERVVLDEDGMNSIPFQATDEGAYNIHLMDDFTRNFHNGQSDSWGRQEGGLMQIPYQNINPFSASTRDESGEIIQSPNVFNGELPCSEYQDILMQAPSQFGEVLQAPYQGTDQANGIWPLRESTEVMPLSQVGAEHLNDTWPQQSLSVPFYVTTNNVDDNNILQPGTIIELPPQNSNSGFEPNYAWREALTSISYSARQHEQFDNYSNEIAANENQQVFFPVSSAGQAMMFQTCPVQQSAAVQGPGIIYKYTDSSGDVISRPVNIIYEGETPIEHVGVTGNDQTECEQNEQTVEMPDYVSYEPCNEYVPYAASAYGNASNSSINNGIQYESPAEREPEVDDGQIFWEQSGQAVTVPNALSESENIFQEEIPVEQEIVIENGYDRNRETIELFPPMNHETITEYGNDNNEESLEGFSIDMQTLAENNFVISNDTANQISSVEIDSDEMSRPENDQQIGVLPGNKTAHDTNVNVDEPQLLPTANDQISSSRRALFWKQVSIQIPDVISMPPLRTRYSTRAPPLPKTDSTSVSLLTHFDESSKRTPFIKREAQVEAKDTNRRKQKLFNKPGIENFLLDIQTNENIDSEDEIAAPNTNGDSYTNMVVPELDEFFGHKQKVGSKNTVEYAPHQKKLSQLVGKKTPYLPAVSTTIVTRARTVAYNNRHEVNMTFKCFKCAEFFVDVKALVDHVPSCKGREVNNNEANNETKNSTNNEVNSEK